MLEGVDERDIKDYESHAQLHLKHILTTINKHKLEDTTAVKVIWSIRRQGNIDVLLTATVISSRKEVQVANNRRYRS